MDGGVTHIRPSHLRPTPTPRSPTGSALRRTSPRSATPVAVPRRRPCQYTAGAGVDANSLPGPRPHDAASMPARWCGGLCMAAASVEHTQAHSIMARQATRAARHANRQCGKLEVGAWEWAGICIPPHARQYHIALWPICLLEIVQARGRFERDQGAEIKFPNLSKDHQQHRVFDPSLGGPPPPRWPHFVTKCLRSARQSESEET